MSQQPKVYRLYSHGYEMMVRPTWNMDGWVGFFRERRQQPYTVATEQLADLQEAKLAVCREVHRLAGVAGVAGGSAIDACQEALNAWTEENPSAAQISN